MLFAFFAFSGGLHFLCVFVHFLCVFFASGAPEARRGSGKAGNGKKPRRCCMFFAFFVVVCMSFAFFAFSLRFFAVSLRCLCVWGA